MQIMGVAALAALALLTPQIGAAQGLTDSLSGMHAVLDKVYNSMMPLCGRLIGVARGIAGFAALWYIASRVWRQMATAQPIDFYPLLRPFGIGLAIVFFPALMALINGVLQPTVSETGAMVRESNLAIESLLKRKAEALKKTKSWQVYVGEDGNGDRAEWYKYTHPDDDQNGNGEGMFESISNDVKFWMDKKLYAFKNNIKQWLKEVLELLYMAASLCINTLRTFFMVVLTVLGPLVLGFSVFDGFQHTLTVWLARYINIYLWLPVASIFGSILGQIQQEMLKLDIAQIGENGGTVFSETDIAYLIFLIIGIVGYFSVPNVANYIVNAGGGNSLLHNVNTIVINGGQSISKKAMGGMGMAGDSFGDMARNVRSSFSGAQGGDYFADGGKGSEHQRDRLSGK